MPSSVCIAIVESPVVNDGQDESETWAGPLKRGASIIHEFT